MGDIRGGEVRWNEELRGEGQSTELTDESQSGMYHNTPAKLGEFYWR